jgi:hypothetical protein
MIFKLGKWYESKEQVRAHFGEYWKGILLNEKDVGIIFNFEGARRKHYGDSLDYVKNQMTYIGEGKKGNQSKNARNQALLNAEITKKPIKVFLDCGDLFKPKKILYAGLWLINSHCYSSQSGRKVFKFYLSPETQKTADLLAHTFSALGHHTDFERDLKRFALERRKLYTDHSSIVRARDNISGEIGEYFAIKAFNKANPENPLIRLTSGIKDIDAIQIGRGKRVAIKTVSKIPSATSNIWSKEVASSVDAFIIVYMDQDRLRPHATYYIPVTTAVKFLKKDNYQGKCWKLQITEELLRKAKTL